MNRNVTERDASGKQPQFAEFSRRVNEHLKEKYGLEVIAKDVVDSADYAGSFDGKRIIIKSGLRPDYSLFLTAHLFGHCVQWCGPNGDTYADVDTAPVSGKIAPLSDEMKIKLRRYEIEAAGYAVQMLDDALHDDLSQWFSDWSNADWDYFTRIDDLTAKPAFPVNDIPAGSPLIAPLPIPRIVTKEIGIRYAY